MFEPGEVGLLRRRLTDRELLSIAVSGEEIMTLNVHPLYLPPEVCWINNTYLRLRAVKSFSARIRDGISHCIVLFTLLIHAISLTAGSRLQTLEACWSVSVSVAFLIGIGASVITAEVGAVKISPLPLGSALQIHRALLSASLCASYIMTAFHARGEPETSALVCWTTFAFVWINTCGLLRITNSLG